MGTRGKWQWTDGQLFLPPLTEGQPRPHMHEGTSVLDLQVRQPILMEWCELVGLKTAHGRCLVRAPQLATRRWQGQRRQTACVELQV